MLGLLAVMACAPAPPTLVLTPEDDELAEVLGRVSAWYAERGFEVVVGKGGRPVFWGHMPPGELGFSMGPKGIVVAVDFDWWVSGACGDRFSLEENLRHEVGHQLRFVHVDDSDDVMYGLTWECTLREKCSQCQALIR